MNDFIYQWKSLKFDRLMNLCFIEIKDLSYVGDFMIIEFDSFSKYPKVIDVVKKTKTVEAKYLKAGSI